MRTIAVFTLCTVAVLALASPALAVGSWWVPDGAAAPGDGGGLLGWLESLFAGWIINPDG